MTERIRVFIVDDHALFREGLARLLESEPRLAVVGSAGSVGEAMTKLRETQADVLIADYDLGASTALPLLQQVAEAGLSIRTLLVTAGVPDHQALELVRLGASGILLKQRDPDDLKRSILDVAEGKVVLDQTQFQNLVASAAVGGERIKLTNRDRQVLALLLEGQSNKLIGAELGVSESAVKAALQQLFAKTGVRTRSQLVRYALEQLRDEL